MNISAADAVVTGACVQCAVELGLPPLVSVGLSIIAAFVVYELRRRLDAYRASQP